MMNEEQFKLLKDFIKVDDDLEDSLIKEQVKAAEELLFDKGIKTNYDSALYRKAVFFLVSHWYDRRDPVLIGSISKNLEYSLNEIIVQLQCRGDNIE